MRMTIRVENKFFYDIGLRSKYDNTSKITRTFNEDHPKYLQDFIEFYGKENVHIISYGDLKNKREEIKEMFI